MCLQIEVHKIHRILKIYFLEMEMCWALQGEDLKESNLEGKERVELKVVLLFLSAVSLHAVQRQFSFKKKTPHGVWWLVHYVTLIAKQNKSGNDID